MMPNGDERAVIAGEGALNRRGFAMRTGRCGRKAVESSRSATPQALSGNGSDDHAHHPSP